MGNNIKRTDMKSKVGQSHELFEKTDNWEVFPIKVQYHLTNESAQSRMTAYIWLGLKFLNWSFCHYRRQLLTLVCTKMNLIQMFQVKTELIYYEHLFVKV